MSLGLANQYMVHMESPGFNREEEVKMEPCWHAFMDVQLKYIRKGMNNGITEQE